LTSLRLRVVTGAYLLIHREDLARIHVMASGSLQASVVAPDSEVFTETVASRPPSGLAP
jgi:hypothetical protein